MSRKVTVIDYGMGNIMSVSRAFEHFGADVVLTDDPAQVINADHLVLPGVGAFGDGMSGLKERGIDKAIKEFAVKGRPFLGICLGMQMMLDSSEEFGFHEGLGLIKGKVVAIPEKGADGISHKIPHIGWNRLLLPSHGKGWDGTVLANIEPGIYSYFVHSFSVVPDNEENRLADCDYDGCLISAAVRSGNIYGCQFHPEKSGEAGLKIIKNFLEL